MTRLDALAKLHAEAQGGDYAPVRVEVLGQLIAVARAAEQVRQHGYIDHGETCLAGRNCTCGVMALGVALAEVMEEHRGPIGAGYTPWHKPRRSQ